MLSRLELNNTSNVVAERWGFLVTRSVIFYSTGNLGYDDEGKNERSVYGENFSN